jgi:hypothetical protein
MDQQNQYSEISHNTKTIYRFKIMPIENSMTFFTDTVKSILEFIRKQEIP